jgi:opacity protein-like surface antigen
MKKLSLLLLFLAPTVVLAQATSYLPTFPWECLGLRPVLSLGGGVTFVPTVGSTNNFPIIDPDTDEFYNYSRQDNTRQVRTFNGFIGAEATLAPLWNLQLGFEYDQLGQLKAEGSFVQGADVQSQDQYNYNYLIRSKQFLAESKLLYTIDGYYHPYIAGGIGLGSNKNTQYSTDVPPFLTFTRMYADHKTNSIAYNIGLGLDIDISSHLRLGGGYRFANLGKQQLGQAMIDTTAVPGTLNQKNLYANELLAQATLVF